MSMPNGSYLPTALFGGSKIEPVLDDRVEVEDREEELKESGEASAVVSNVAVVLTGEFVSALSQVNLEYS